MLVLRTKEWIKYLPEGFAIYLTLRTFLGNINSFSVVLVKDDECVTRYDTAHGFVHRDVIGRRNALIMKERYDRMNLKEAFDHANRDLSEKYASYYDFYQSH
jgi:hypothetical protein